MKIEVRKMSHLSNLNAQYPMRRTKQEKADFRAHVTQYLTEKGVPVTTETTKNGKNHNLIVGNPKTAQVVCTAHYDTPATSLFPNIMMPRNKTAFYTYQFVPILALLVGVMALVVAVYTILFLAIGLTTGVMIDEKMDERIIPIIFLILYYALLYLMFFAFKNKNNYNDNTSGVATLLEIIDRLSPAELEKVAFIFFDNEEKGLKGSKGYYKDHKEEMKNRLLINFDCVGNGENVLFIAKKEAEKMPLYQSLQTILTPNDTYQTTYYPIKGSAANSDYKVYPCGVCCVACKKTKGGFLYTPYIHTAKDTVAKDENIAFLADGMKNWISTAL